MVDPFWFTLSCLAWIGTPVMAIVITCCIIGVFSHNSDYRRERNSKERIP